MLFFQLFFVKCFNMLKIKKKKIIVIFEIKQFAAYKNRSSEG